MKKSLPVSLFLLLASTAAAATPVIQPQVYADIDFSSISDNGEWLAGLTADGFSVIIRNTVTGEEWLSIAELYPNGDPIFRYGLGLDRCVSDDGIVVGAENEVAAYWKEGKWYRLPVPSTGLSNASSITPDGRVIVGYCPSRGRAGGVVWTRKDDGTYSDPVVLPTPSRDITGRSPQYVNAISVSHDGKTVAGLMRDALGVFQQPVVFTINDKGTWSYKVLGNELLNPTGVVFPPYPSGNPGAMPNYEDYLTPENQREWERVHDEWLNGDQSEPEPLIDQFMTPEMAEKWHKVYDPWYEKYIKWYEKMVEYENAQIECMENGIEFIQNNVRLSADGKYLASTGVDEKITPGDFEPIIEVSLGPVLFDTETGEATVYSFEDNILVSGVSDNYSILGSLFDPNGIKQRKAYIYPAGELEPVALEEYIYSVDPFMGEWMEDNMLQSVILDYNYITQQFVFGEEVCSGIPKATGDLSIFVTTIGTDMWEDLNVAGIYSYVFPAKYVAPEKPDESSVEEVEAAVGAISFIGGGQLQVQGEHERVEVYDLSGACLYGIDNPSGVVATGLGAGIYVVRALGADGTAVTLKAIER